MTRVIFAQQAEVGRTYRHVSHGYRLTVVEKLEAEGGRIILKGPTLHKPVIVKPDYLLREETNR